MQLQTLWLIKPFNIMFIRDGRKVYYDSVVSSGCFPPFSFPFTVGFSLASFALCTLDVVHSFNANCRARFRELFFWWANTVRFPARGSRHIYMQIKPQPTEATLIIYVGNPSNKTSPVLMYEFDNLWLTFFIVLRVSYYHIYFFIFL